MKAYLRLVNPVVSALVFLLCMWAAFGADNGGPGEIINDSPRIYFAAKGLFCGTALFLLGRILLEMIERRERDAGAGKAGGQQGDSPRT